MSEKKDLDEKSLHEKIMDKRIVDTEVMKSRLGKIENTAEKSSYRMAAMIHMAVLGWSPKEIALQLKITPTRVSAVLNSKSAKEQIYKGQQELFVKDPQKMFLNILPEAVNTARKIMKSKTTTASVRTDAAFKFMDRALGKPVQEIKHEGNAIRELFAALDKRNRGEEEVTIKKDAIDAEFKEIKSDVGKDPLDSWLDENL